jgi:TRAP-type C4-dicarboxylate transport system substrate-binding protein
MLTRRSLFISMTLVALLVALAGTAAGKVEVRVATLAHAGSSQMKLRAAAATEINKQTEGRATFKYYARGAYGEEREMVRKMNLGHLDGAELSSVGLALIDGGIRVLELPRMFATVEEFDYVAEKMWPIFQKRFEQKGYTLGGRGAVGWSHVMSKSEMRSVADLKTAKIWLRSDDGVTSALYKRLGVSGVSLGLFEVEPNLTTGRINAFYGSPLMALELNWSTKIKYMTSLPVAYGVSAMVTTQDAVKKMSATDQRLVSQVTLDLSAKLRSAVRADNERARAQMQRSGVAMTDSTADFIAALDKAAKEVWSDLTGKMFSKAELDQVLEHRKEYRKKSGVR